MAIERLDAIQATELIGGLAALLRDAVESGASVGFLPPLSEEESLAYWRGVIEEAGSGDCVLLVDHEDGKVLGSVQLAPAGKPNGRHRAELQKLLVHRAARRHGRGMALIAAAEDEARRAGRTLIVLDTREGDQAEHLYQRAGYREGGRIPGYALNADGSASGTVLYYRFLQD
ncbi:MAG TPA: GNAT family N-acetyltransferase [Chloroflexota bacterium]|nr:GNAT family N-acetyltransferase [Chloroflexota bacterium]